MRRAWEEGHLYRDRFQHVFYFSCRELAQCKRLSLAELIAKDQAVPTAPIRQILSHPEKLLFILDGIDEPTWDLEEQNAELCLHWSQPQPVQTLLGSLLGKCVLPGASLLLTARTTVLKFIPSLGQPQWVEVLGFSESGLKKYIYKYFTDTREAIEAFRLVDSNPVLSTLCLVPWVSWLVCTCLKQQMKNGGDLSLTSQTTTALCLKYVSQILPDHTLGTQFRTLCSLAAEGICRRQTLFSETDLCEQGLSEDVIGTFLKIGVLLKHPKSLTYRFAHFCLQEFFTAMSCVLGNNNAKKCGDMRNYRIVETLVEVYGRQGLFEAPTIRFLFGLLNKQVMNEIEKIFTTHLPPLTLWEMLDKAKALPQDQNLYSLGLFHCFYEIQNEELLTQVMHNLKTPKECDPTDMMHPVFQTNVRHLVVLTDIELMVVTFCIKFCRHVKRIQLTWGRQLRQILTAPKMVLSRWTQMTNASWRILFSTLEVTGSLEELDLSGNPMSYFAICGLCRTLRCPECHLKTLWLVNCGLTSRHCKDLASVLGTSSSLAELDLQLNDLGDHGVRMLCEGLRNPSCNLRILRLDLAPLSNQVMMELRALEADNPQLLISSKWKPRVMVSTKNMYAEEMSDSPISCKRQRLQSEGYSQPAHLEPFHPSSPDSPKEKHLETLGTEDEFWGPTGPVATEVIDRERNLYRVQFPVAGFYHCSNIELSFVVKRAVTIDIGFCAWNQHLNETPLLQNHMVAGPLFDIKAEQGAVTAVYLPHFVALQEKQVDDSLLHVAHFQDHGIVLETPARVGQHYVVLENPSFSPVGVVMKMTPAMRRSTLITPITLIYYHLNLKDVTLHLYLVPNDCTIRKAIDDEEMKFQFLRINKPPPVDSLYIGSRYIISGSKKLQIIPKELKLCYRSPGESQLFSEICVGHMNSEIMLQIRDKKHKKVIWKAMIKPRDLIPALPITPAVHKDALALLHFIDQHREQLVARVTSVDPLLDKLHGSVLSAEEYEAVRAETQSRQDAEALHPQPVLDQGLQRPSL
ncbi:NACHT, LRR and PYD domains-containing protein 1a-like [Sigmodon hispidus]